MNYGIVLSDNFKKEAKLLIIKYRSLKTELEVLGEELSQYPTLGTPLGSDVYKILLAIKSKGKGKSGGARVISYVKIDHEPSYCFLYTRKGKKTPSLIRKYRNYSKSINEKSFPN